MPHVTEIHHVAIIFLMGTNRDIVEVFFVPHLTDLLWTPYKSQFWSRAPDFKRTYLRPQEELENVLTIQIEPKFSALSVYEVFRAIPALLPYQNNDFRGVNKKTSTLCPLKKIIAICYTASNTVRTSGTSVNTVYMTL